MSEKPTFHPILTKPLTVQQDTYIQNKGLTDEAAERVRTNLKAACPAGFVLTPKSVESVKVEMDGFVARGLISQRRGSELVNTVKALYQHVVEIAAFGDASTTASGAPKTEPPKSGDDAKKSDGVGPKKPNEPAAKK